MQIKQCTKCKQNFTIDDHDEEFYKSLKVPHPTHCPDCRQQRRLAWRNERTLYKRACSGTGKRIISVYSEDKPFPVYDNDHWYSDTWDPEVYGRDFDFSRPFFEQFEKLFHQVPQLARSALANENCDHVNQCGWCKNCYMIFEADHNRDCYHSNNIYDSVDCLDCFFSNENQLCYECVDCTKCYNLNFSQDCDLCSDSWFLKNCVGCKNCFGCINLHNKEHHYFNKKLSREEYEHALSKIPAGNNGELEKMRQKFREACVKFPQKFMHGTQNEDSTGDYLWNTQRCLDCYDVNNAQDCRYVHNSRSVKMVYDMMVFGGKGSMTEFCVDNHEIGGGMKNIFYCDQCWENCYDLYYCKLCITNSHHLFGCVGMRHREYCILNKKYAPKEYETFKNRIIEHMKKTGEFGEFFPAKLSPYGYNETVAQNYFPLTREEAIVKSFNWKD